MSLSLIEIRGTSKAIILIFDAVRGLSTTFLGAQVVIVKHANPHISHLPRANLMGGCRPSDLTISEKVYDVV
jgi:hypothetical protein